MRVDVELPTGEAYRFPIEAHAYPPGEAPEGAAEGPGHGHGH